MSDEKNTNLPRVIVVNDVPYLRESIKTQLEERGYFVTSVNANTHAEFLPKLRAHLNRINLYDFLILDIQLGNDFFGGIHLYNALVSQNKRLCWKHTIILSQHAHKPIHSIGWSTSDIREAYIIRIFAETAGISEDNIFNSLHDAHEPVFARMNKLLYQPPAPICYACHQHL
ncbi:MAG: hypothetical protein R3B84_16135 [Zavarzinella sp.]